MTNIWIWLALIVTVPGMGVTPQMPEQAGTYRIWACRKPCTSGDTTQAIVEGVVVLGDRAGVDELPHDVREGLRKTWLSGGPGYNGCFVLESRPITDGLFAGIIPPGLLMWRPEGEGQVIFSLYSSPDGGFQVTATVDDEGFVGEGVQWHFPDTPRQPLAHVWGQRVGVVNFEQCVAAVRATEQG